MRCLALLLATLSMSVHASVRDCSDGASTSIKWESLKQSRNGAMLSVLGEGHAVRGIRAGGETKVDATFDVTVYSEEIATCGTSHLPQVLGTSRSWSAVFDFSRTTWRIHTPQTHTQLLLELVEAPLLELEEAPLLGLEVAPLRDADEMEEELDEALRLELGDDVRDALLLELEEAPLLRLEEAPLLWLEEAPLLGLEEAPLLERGPRAGDGE